MLIPLVKQELAAYVFADRIKLLSRSFHQHDNHLRNAAHYDKLLKNYALRLSQAREIAPETLEGMILLFPALYRLRMAFLVVISAVARTR